MNTVAPKGGLAFAGSTLDRRAHWREKQDPALAVSLSGDHALVCDMEAGSLGLVLSPDAGEGEAVHVGRREDGHAVIARDIGGAEPREGQRLLDLRTLAMQGLLPADDLALLAAARSLLFWHQRHRFCANCGAVTTFADRGHRRDCGSCAAQHFPRTDPVAIVAATGEKGMLLGRGPHFLPGVYSALAGFLEPGETIEEAARREVWEECGIRLGEVSYCASQPWPFPSSLMIGLTATATSHDIVIDPGELEDARWFGREEIERMMAETHPDGFKVPRPAAIAHHIIKTALQRLPR